MKLSLRSEYALLTLIYLARNSGTALQSEIATVQQIPAEPLAEILAVLKRSDYLEQVDGCFRLVKNADGISVAEIIRLFDGALAPLEPVSSKGYVFAPMDQEEKLAGLFDQIQGQISARLEATTIAELA
jgi:Rrf2 family transcriptional regulator, cysteine metabolism repressor